jgi:hypothetical protein
MDRKSSRSKQKTIQGREIVRRAWEEKSRGREELREDEDWIEEGSRLSYLKLSSKAANGAEQ